MKRITCDGNAAAANIAYMFNDMAFIYPITPSSNMAELCDQFVYEKRTNIFGNPLQITQMQSEGGVAGALHGAISAGSLATTFTSSQGLLLMLPNMYKIAGEMLPNVIYVSARSLATHALNIFCDYADIYSTLKTGYNIISCSNVQEVNDLSILAQLASIDTSTPFIIFFDGFRISHELNTIEQTEKQDIMDYVNFDAIAKFKANALSNVSPFVKGTAQNPDVFFQNRITGLKNYNRVLPSIKENLKKIEKITKRTYDTIDYFGNQNAENVVICMGSAGHSLNAALSECGDKCGYMQVRVFKPFDEETFIKKLPETVKNITVLERNFDINGKDVLYTLINTILYKHNINAKTYAGVYGLGGKDFTPDMAISVFENMENRQLQFFTVGITDDLTNTSLEVVKKFKENTQGFCMRTYGLGNDGSVSASKSTIKILSDRQYAQGYFDYDSKKSGSLTISHIRTSDKPINAPYNATNVDFVSCNHFSFIQKYNLTDCLETGGTLLINCPVDENELGGFLSNGIKQDIKNKNLNVYIINANKIAHENGLRNKINTIMQTAFFYISSIISFEHARQEIENNIKLLYSKKGEQIVNSNLNALKAVPESVVKIDTSKLTLNDEKQPEKTNNQFIDEVLTPITNLRGNDIPTSKFNSDGSMTLSTASYEKRGIAQQLPKWNSEACIQCGRCSIMCPHACLRAVIFDEKTQVPESFTSKKAFLTKGQYRMQLSPKDCTGCSVCSEVCPVKGKAIVMVDSNEIMDEEINNHNFSKTLPQTKPFELNSTKGLQFAAPYFEFSGACGGCGETPYIKLATQLFGDRMLIANATGCSSIYGASFPSCPYAKDDEGFGPSWANSLFEDNAEFGLGIYQASKANRDNFINKLPALNLNEPLKTHVNSFLHDLNNHKANKELCIKLKEYFNSNEPKNDDEKYLKNNLNLIIRPSVWIIGGDGWAYDIGFGGLDHVLASGENVNILVLDTEVYSNTGGQTSKATPRGATAKFNLTGKTKKKKDLLSIALTYDDVYVAQVSMGANPDQAVKAFIEAEQYNGVSIIVAYSPCINHGYDMKDSQTHAKNSVLSGYNTLFRFNPSKEIPMQIDSADATQDYINYCKSENRFAILQKLNPTNETELLEKSKSDAASRRTRYKQKSQNK